MDEIDHRLLLLVAEHDGAEHDFLGQLVRFRFHHQHRGFGASDHEVELGRRELGLGGVQHVLIVDVADARRADGARKRNAGERDCSGSADHRGNVRIDLGIDRHHRRDDLHVVVEAVGKQRAQRAVDEPRRQRLLFRRTPFALEEAARDLASGVRLFLVVDGEREEVLSRLGGLGCDARDEHDRVAEAGHDRAGGLASDLAGLERQRVLAVLNGLLDGCRHCKDSANAEDRTCTGAARGGTSDEESPAGSAGDDVVTCAGRACRSACGRCRRCAT